MNKKGQSNLGIFMMFIILICVIILLLFLINSLNKRILDFKDEACKKLGLRSYEPWDYKDFCLDKENQLVPVIMECNGFSIGNCKAKEIKLNNIPIEIVNARK